MNQSSSLPTNKVIAGAVSGAVVAIVVWALKQWAKVDTPPEVAVAMSTVVSAVVAYIVPPSQRDAIA